MQLSRTVGLLLAVLMLLSLAAAVQAQDNGWEFSGYSQFRYVSMDSDLYGVAAEDEFDIRRARVKIEGPVSDETTFRIQVDLGGLDDDGGDDVGLKDLYVKHQINPEWVGRAGFGNMEFGYDVPYSSSKRLPFERSQIAGILLDGERTTGAFFFYEPAANAHSPTVTLGLSEDMDDFHGGGPGQIDEALAFSARAEWPLDDNGSVAGVSFLTSDADYWNGDATDIDNYTDDIWGVHLRYNGVGDYGGLNFQGEYMDGSRANWDADGWYGTLEFTPENSQGTVFYRFDTADMSGMSSDYESNTFGYAHDIDDSQRITAQLKDIDSMSGASGTDFGVQWQVQY